MARKVQAPENLYLSAKEAAAELGVSLATLYAYVSRDMIRSEPVADTRAKRYRAEDVRRLKERRAGRSEEHTSELLSLMRISYAVFCLQKQKHIRIQRAR